MVVDIDDPALSWACLKVKIDGVLYALTKIDLETEVKTAYQYGPGVYPLNITKGVVAYNSSMSMTLGAWHAVLAYFESKGIGWTEAFVEITGEWQYPNEDVKTDTCRARIVKPKKSAEAGAEAGTIVDIGLMPIKQTDNGSEPFKRRAA